MSEELRERDAEFGEVLAETLSLIEEAKKLRGRERVQKIEKIRERISRLKSVLNAYKVEVRFLEQTANVEYREKIKGFEKKVEETSLEVEFLEKDELTGEAGKSSRNTADMTTDQVLNRAADIQRQDVEILHDAIDKTEQDKQLAVDTLAAMGAQRDQLQNARDAVKKMDSEMTLASRQIRVFAKRMVTDKLILGVLIVIAIAVLVVIAVAAAKPAVSAAADAFTKRDNIPEDDQPYDS